MLIRILDIAMLGKGVGLSVEYDHVQIVELGELRPHSGECVVPCKKC